MDAASAAATKAASRRADLRPRWLKHPYGDHSSSGPVCRDSIKVPVLVALPAETAQATDSTA
jgi:hypothetical protein